MLEKIVTLSINPNHTFFGNKLLKTPINSARACISYHRFSHLVAIV